MVDLRKIQLYGISVQKIGKSFPFIFYTI
jgi:hypothetical protein